MSNRRLVRYFWSFVNLLQLQLEIEANKQYETLNLVET